MYALLVEALSIYDTTVDLIHNCTFVRNRADRTLASINFINVSLPFIFFDLKLCCGSAATVVPISRDRNVSKI